MPQYTFDTYNPAMNQQRHQVMAQRQLQDKMAGFGAGMADFGISMGAGALGSIVGGPLGGLAAGMLAPQVAGSYTDRIRQARNIQDMSLSKIVGGQDMSQSIGQGFSLEASARVGSGIRRQAVDDFVFNQEDYSKIMKLGVESGMMDYSNSAEQYKQTIKKLSNNFKVMMDLFETADLGELSKHMQRMQRMGANVKDMGAIGGAEAMFARMTGISHSEMVNSYGQQGAMAFTQAGMTGYQGSLENMANAASVTMMQRTGTLNASEIARQGGVSGAAQRMTTGKARMLNNVGNFMLPGLMNEDGTGLDSDKMDRFLSGEISMQELTSQSADRLDSRQSNVKFMKNRANLMQEFQDEAGTAGTDIAMMNMALQFGGTTNPNASRQDQLFTGFRQMGLDNKTARLYAEKYSSRDVLEGLRDQQRMQSHQMKQGRIQEMKHARRPLNIVGHAFREFSTSFGEDIFGNMLAENAAKADVEEARKAGIYTTSDRGMDNVLTMDADFALTEEEKAEVAAFAGEAVAPGGNRDMYEDRTGYGKLSLSGAAGARSDLERYADQRVRKQVMNGTDISEWARARSREDLGFSSGVEASRAIRKQISGAGDVTMEKMVSIVKKQKRMSDAEAREFLNKDGGRNLKYLSQKLREAPGNKDLLQGVQVEYMDEEGELLEDRMQSLDEAKQERSESIARLTGQETLFGITIGHDKSYSDALKGAMSGTGKSGGAEEILNITSAMMVGESIRQGAGDKGRGSILGEDHGASEKERKAYQRERLKAAGISESVINQVVDHGRVDLLDKELKDRNASEEQIAALKKGIQDGAGDLRDLDKYERGRKKAARSIRTTEVKEQYMEMESRMSDVLGGEHSMKDVIADPSLITDEMLKKADPGTREMLKGVKKLQGADKNKKLSSVEMAVNLSKNGLLSGDASESKLDDVSVVNMSGEEQKQAERFEKNYELLDNTVQKFNKNLKNNTTVTGALAAAIQNKKEEDSAKGGGFSFLDTILNPHR